MTNVFLILTIDTEEDQWGPTQDRPTVHNIKALKRVQKIFDDYGLIPTYLITYPVIDDDEAGTAIPRRGDSLQR